MGEKVLGSANPLAMGFRHGKRALVDSIGGVFIGFLLLLIAVYASTCDVKRLSGNVAKMTPVAAENAGTLSGMQVVTGTPDSIENIVAPLTDKKVFWYDYKKEEFVTEQVKEQKSETVVENGQEKQVTKEVTKEVSDWKVRDEKADYSDFKLGALTVKPDKAKLDITEQNTTKELGKNKDGNDEREVVTYVPVTGPLTVVGEIAGGAIAGGEPFRISTETPDKLVATMKGEETNAFIGHKVLAVLLFTFAFNLMLGPLLLLFKIVPIIGGFLRGIVFFASLVLAIVFVAIITVVVKFWWAILLAGLVITALALMMHHKDKPKPQPAG